MPSKYLMYMYVYYLFRMFESVPQLQTILNSIGLSKQ